MVDIQHRSQIAWMKFNEHEDTLLNRHVSLRLRLKLFDSVITPTIEFGLMTCPLISNQLQKLEVVRNRMLRSIVGWAPLVDNDWHALMQKRNKKLENAQQIFNVRPWTERLLVGRFRFAAKISSAVNSGASITSEWYPYQRWKINYCVEPRRRIGRPAKRWDDQIESFAQEIFHSSWFQAAKSETWSSHEKAFVKWCLECWCLVVIIFPCPSRTVALTRTGIVCVGWNLTDIFWLFCHIYALYWRKIRHFWFHLTEDFIQFCRRWTLQSEVLSLLFVQFSTYGES